MGWIENFHIIVSGIQLLVSKQIGPVNTYIFINVHFVKEKGMFVNFNLLGCGFMVKVMQVCNPVTRNTLYQEESIQRVQMKRYAVEGAIR